MKTFRSILARINRSTLRERALLFAAFLAILASIWHQAIMGPLLARKSVITQSLEDIRAHAASASGLGVDSAAEEYALSKSREFALTSAIAEADADLNDTQIRMIAPKDMMVVLTEVLHRQKDVSLVLLRNLPVEPLLPVAADEKANPDKAAEVGPYLHPVEMVVRGDYLNVLAYLKALESKPLGFQWRRFELSSTDTGPEYRIEFTTVSMQKNWLGV
jgi:MSHA biogenesis protein MshJ